MKKSMKRVTKIIIISVASVVVIVGVILVIRFGNIGKKADVFPVALLNEEYWGESNALQATVTTGKIQQVALKEGLVKEIKVNEGDVVKKGDILMSYDQTSFQITLMKDQANIADCEASIAMCNENIQKYSRLKPKEDAPQPYIEIIDHGELPAKYTLKADDESDSIIVFETTITKEFLEKLKTNNQDACLKVYSEMIIPGGKEQILFGTYEIKAEDLDEIDSDWCLSNIIKVNQDRKGITFDTSKNLNYKGAFISCEPTRYERYEEIIHYPDATESEDYVYTRAELAAMISAEAREASRLSKELVAIKINYEMDKAVAENGDVKASINGKVSKALSPSELSQGEIIIEVRGSDKDVITTYINEIDLNNISVGDGMNVTLYERGISTHAKIVEIIKEPNNQIWGNGNTNVSFYPVLAEIDDDTISLNIGEWGEATLDNQQDEKGVFIPPMYVRKDSNGSYVMKNDHGHLKKQYITTGKVYNNFIVNIKEGLSLDDYIAFPYDKGAISGISVKKNEEMVY